MRLSLPRLKMPRLPGFSILVWISTALKGWVMGSREKDTDSLIMYDRTLLWLTFGLAAIGFIMVTARSWRRYTRKWQNKPKLWNRRCACWLRVFSRAIWFCSPRPVPALISSRTLNNEAMSLPVWRRS